VAEFIWLDDYQIGNETIDQQHKYLFELANLIVDPQHTHAIRTNFMQLFKYVREHFSAEETLMKKHNYPRYGKHLIEHEKLLDHLLEISESIGRGQFQHDKIVNFMKNWLLVHIVEEDMLLGEFFRELNLLRSPAQPHPLRPN